MNSLSVLFYIACFFFFFSDDNVKECVPQITLLVEKELPSVAEEDRLALSIDWSLNLNSSSCNEINLAVSDSKGCVSIFVLNDDSLEVINSWKAHNFEAWIVSFNHWNNSVIYTGERL